MKKALYIALMMMFSLVLITGCSKKEEASAPEPTAMPSEQAPAVVPDEVDQTGMEEPITEPSFESEPMGSMETEATGTDTMESEPMGTSDDEGMMLESTPAEEEANTVQ